MFSIKPDIDLHLHLDGSIKPTTIKELYIKKYNKEFPANVELSIKKGMPSLVEYLGYFDFPLMVIKDNLQTIERIAYEMVEQLSSNGVKYAEVRYAPQLFVSVLTQENIEKVIHFVNIGFKKGMVDFPGTCVKSIICLMRGMPYEINEMTYLATLNMSREEVVGIDIAGDEYNYSGEDLKEIFLDAKKNDLHITIHAGENAGSERIRLALDLGAERIGHGLALWHDKNLLREVAERKICIETCPISNFQTGAILRYGYHIEEMLNYGIPVCMNTDNMTVSNTNLVEEMNYLAKEHSFTKDLIQEMIKNAYEYKFYK